MCLLTMVSQKNELHLAAFLNSKQTLNLKKYHVLINIYTPFSDMVMI